MTNTNQTAMAFSFSATHGTESHSFKPGSITWHKTERCTVLDTVEMAEMMVRVMFDDNRIGIFYPRELGLTAANARKYLASVKK